MWEEENPTGSVKLRHGGSSSLTFEWRGRRKRRSRVCTLDERWLVYVGTSDPQPFTLTKTVPPPSSWVWSFRRHRPNAPPYTSGRRWCTPRRTGYPSSQQRSITETEQCRQFGLETEVSLRSSPCFFGKDELNGLTQDNKRRFLRLTKRWIREIRRMTLLTSSIVSDLRFERWRGSGPVRLSVGGDSTPRGPTTLP